MHRYTRAKRKHKAAEELLGGPGRVQHCGTSSLFRGRWKPGLRGVHVVLDALLHRSREA